MEKGEQGQGEKKSDLQWQGGDHQEEENQQFIVVKLFPLENDRIEEEHDDRRHHQVVISR